MSEFPFRYDHHDSDALDGDVYFPVGVGVRGFAQCLDADGRPGVALSFKVPSSDGEETITFLMAAPVVGVLLGFLTEFGDAAGIAVFLQAEADRTVAEIHRIGYQIISGTDLAGLPGFTCPRCGITSYHPDDVAGGYCGHCHDWTGTP